MSARRVICPGCQAKLQVPPAMTEGKIRCPKCGTIMAIRAPGTGATGPGGTAAPAAAARAPAVGPTAAQAPAARPRVPRAPAAGPLDDFSDLPNFSTAGSFPPAGMPGPRTGAAGFGFPGSAPSYPPRQFQGRSPAPAYTAKPRKARGAGSGAALKVLGIVGGIGFLGILLCAGSLATVGVLASRSSGWEPATFQGITIDMPAGNQRQTKSQPSAAMMVHEMIGRRKETGSQYSLVVGDLGARFADLSLDDVMGNMRILMSQQNPVQRAGINGIGGTIISGVGAGSEAEIFVHNGKLVISMYAPYSEIKDRVGGKTKPRSNERKLDDPETFFASLRFQ